MASSSKNSNARAKAAEARAAEEAAQKRRQRVINISIGAVLVLVIAAIVGGALLTKQGNKAAVQPEAGAKAPTGAIASGQPNQYGVPISEAPGKPTLAIWEDFQCPACKQFEEQMGATIEEIAKAGDATVIWRSTSFLDQNYPGQNSQRAAAAYGCAVDAGKGIEYHDTVFANQPATEGDGYTQEQLLGFGTSVGITGDAKATFDKCVTDKTYMSWAANGTASMAAEGVQGTPSLYLNGQELEDQAAKTPEGLKKAIADAARGAAPPSASSEPSASSKPSGSPVKQ
jgi:protein-disulfide isomerase